MSYPRLGAYALEPAPAVTAAAQGWPLVYVSRETSPNHARGPAVLQPHLVCVACDQSVVCLSPDAAGAGFVLTGGMVTSHVVAHMRQRHEDSVPAA